MKLAVVIDSLAYLPERIRNRPDLFVAPIPLIMGGKIYNEGIDIEADEYYGLLKDSRGLPTTSQPAIGEVSGLYEELKEKGYDTILNIHLFSGISGLVDTLFTMKDDISGVAIIPYDSKVTSIPMGHMAEVTLDLSNEGQSLDEVFAHIGQIRDDTYVYLIIDGLNNLIQGGRSTNGIALTDSLLKVKPTLIFFEGKVVLPEKVRSSKKAFARAEEIISRRSNEIQPPVKLYVIHASNLGVAIAEKEKLQKEYPNAEVGIGHLGPVTGTHSGEKTVDVVISAR